MAKYASKLRPISLGCYPKYKDNQVLNIVNFDERKTYKDVLCWGYVEYEKDIPEEDAASYDLQRLKAGESRIRATKKYEDANYDKVLVRMKKGEKEMIKAKADELGVSVNEFINQAIRKYIGD